MPEWLLGSLGALAASAIGMAIQWGATKTRLETLERDHTSLRAEIAARVRTDLLDVHLLAMRAEIKGVSEKVDQLLDRETTGSHRIIRKD